MKNKLFLVVMVGIMVSAFLVLLPGCSDPQDVKIVPDKANRVDKVTVLQTTDLNGRIVMISWDAVDDASTYYVYMQGEGKKSITYLGSGSSGSVGVDTYSYTYRVPSLSSLTVFVPGLYRFGVKTVPISNYQTDSDIRWSEDYINISPY
jgi:hypothetical protein